MFMNACREKKVDSTMEFLNLVAELYNPLKMPEENTEDDAVYEADTIEVEDSFENKFN